MLKLNGLKYSKEIFENYKFRAVAMFEKNNKFHKLDIYTTDESKQNTSKVLINSTQKGVSFFKLLLWCSKEEDDNTAELITDYLNET